jgi:hypothetical protein
MAGLGRPIHHPQHPKPTGSQEAPNEQAGDGEKGDVEPRLCGCYLQKAALFDPNTIILDSTGTGVQNLA